jgi:hypothetical protein
VNLALYSLPLLIAVLFVLERRFPLRTAKASFADRLPVNVGLARRPSLRH